LTVGGHIESSSSNKFCLYHFEYTHTFSVYMQLRLFFHFFPFIANIYTTCFGLIGRLQEYKLVTQGGSYKKIATVVNSFFMLYGAATKSVKCCSYFSLFHHITSYPMLCMISLVEFFSYSGV
jgi:hypothetical protein